MTAATDQAPPIAEVEVLLRHASCLERAAADPEAAPRIAAYLRAEAALARTAASLAGVNTPDNTKEDPRANT